MISADTEKQNTRNFSRTKPNRNSQRPQVLFRRCFNATVGFPDSDILHSYSMCKYLKDRRPRRSGKTMSNIFG